MPFTDDDVLTIQELADRLKEDVYTASMESARSEAIARVRTRAPWAFIQAGSNTVTVPVVKGLARIPRPCTTIASVLWMLWDGSTMTAVGWAFDGVDTLSGLDPFCQPYDGRVIPRRPEPTNVQVTYTGGYTTFPGEVKGVVMSLAIRIYDNPTGATSKSYTASAYSESTRYAGGGANDVGSELLASELKTLRKYRRGASSVRLG